MATNWNTADRETRERLLAEYDALPNNGPDKQTWIAQHKLNAKTAHSALSALRAQMRKAAKQARKQAKQAAPVTSMALVLANGDTKAELLRQYDAMGHGARRQWLKERGLYRTWPTSARASVKKAAATATVRKDLDALARVTEEPLPATPAPVTLQEAIMAFEVRQDIMREFIDQLKRMSQGAR